MPKTRLPRRFVGFTLILLMGGCAVGNRSLADQQVVNGGDNATDVAKFSTLLSYQMYNILAAEMFARKGDAAQAALHYVAAAEQAQDPAIAKRAAELAIRAGDLALATRALAVWIKLEPNSADAHQYRALLNMRNAKYDDVVPDLVFVRDEVEKKEGHGFEFIVSLLTLDSQADQTYEVFKRYVEKVDASPRAQLILATMALNMGNADEALKAASVAKEQGDDPQKEQAARLMAKALISQKHIPEAIAVLEPLAKTSKNPEVKLDYARLLMLADRGQDATALFKQLYAAQPDNAEILYSLGILYIEQKEYAFAEPLIKKLQQVPDHAADANYFMGQIQEGLNHPQEALTAYQQATSGTFGAEALGRVVNLMFKQQGLPTTRKWLAEQVAAADTVERKSRLQLMEAQLLHEQQQYKAAITVLDHALQAKPNDTDLLYARALSRERAKNFTAAESDLRAILKLKPDDATYLNALGYMLVENSKRYPEAADFIGKALAKRPDDPAIMDSMGWISFRTGKLDDAEKWLRKAYAGLQEPEIASHLVEVLAARGNNAEAKMILQHMLEKFPNDPMLISIKQKLASL